MPNPSSHRLIRLADIVGEKPRPGRPGRPGRPALISISKATWLRCVARGEAPQPVRISAGTIAWVESEVIAWIEARAAARGKAA
jgi:predicted DNA-binding transcriptional regulator AlpA